MRSNSASLVVERSNWVPLRNPFHLGNLEFHFFGGTTSGGAVFIPIVFNFEHWVFSQATRFRHFASRMRSILEQFEPFAANQQELYQ
jgi:hypothetical protein